MNPTENMSITLSYESWMISLEDYYRMLQCIWRRFRFKVFEEVDWNGRSLKVEVKDPELTVHIEASEEWIKPEYLPVRFPIVRIILSANGKLEALRKFEFTYKLCTLRGGG